MKPGTATTQRARHKREFFFAEAAAGMYDVTIGWVVPNYDSCHRFAMYLLQGQKLRAGDAILDVGSGTGTDSLAILQAFPEVRVYSIDFCQRIQHVHQRKLRELDSRTLRLRERSVLLCADITGFGTGTALLERLGRSTRFAAFVSGFTVHHFENAEKLEFYRLAYDILRPGGALINADLYSYADQEMNRRALEFDLTWMRREFSNPSDEIAPQISASRRAKLLRLWISHYQKANRLHPLEDAGKTRGQLSMVRDTGFRRAAVPYRMSLSGILFAQKSN